MSSEVQEHHEFLVRGVRVVDFQSSAVAIGVALIQALDRLGLNAANTDQGAIEVLAGEIKVGCERIGRALEAIADAIHDGGDDE
jgi:hypothetical protein